MYKLYILSFHSTKVDTSCHPTRNFISSHLTEAINTHHRHGVYIYTIVARKRTVKSCAPYSVIPQNRGRHIMSTMRVYTYTTVTPNSALILRNSHPVISQQRGDTPFCHLYVYTNTMTSNIAHVLHWFSRNQGRHIMLPLRVIH